MKRHVMRRCNLRKTTAFKKSCLVRADIQGTLFVLESVWKEIIYVYIEGMHYIREKPIENCGINIA